MDQTGTSQPVRFNFLDIEREARNLIDDARTRARTLLQAAMKEAQRIKESAREEGRQEGVQQGIDEGFANGKEQGMAKALEEARVQNAEHIDTLQQTVSSILSAWENDYRVLRETAERDLLRLSVAIAEKLVQKEIIVDNEQVLRSVTRAMHLASGALRVRIHVNPEDLSTCETFLPEVMAMRSELESVTWVSDESVDRGGAVLHSDSGDVDAQMSTQITMIRRALLGEANEDSSIEESE